MGKKAIPTEYKGVRFRSKSEAVFARCLDLSPSVKKWEYEPEWTCKCPHQFDFIVGFHGSYCVPVLIEYKPSKPTKVYVDNLRKLIEDHACEQIRSYGRLHQECWIVFGSPWKWADDEEAFDSIGLLSYWSAAPFHDTFKLAPEMIEEAKSYRFDLE